MKLKCSKCDTLMNQTTCQICGNQGGYSQIPNIKTVGSLEIHLEDVLIHTPSNNEYKIKELQTGGLIAVLVASPILPEKASIGMKVYISNTTISEYTKKS